MKKIAQVPRQSDGELVPELLLFVTPALEAITRTVLLHPEDLREAVEALAGALYHSALRNHPDTLRVLREFVPGDPAAEFRGMEYLAQVGFPKRRPRCIAQSGGVHEYRRMTLPSVRALWGLSLEAVEEVFDLEEPQRKSMALSLSWSYHRTLLERFPWYRKEVSRLDATLAADAGMLSLLGRRMAV